MTRPVRGGEHPALVGADGLQRFPAARKLLITADGGGSNGVGPGCGRWNCRTGRRRRAGAQRLPLSAGHEQVEQDRASAFRYITQNWRGRPLVSHEVIVSLIASTTTTGLTVQSDLDTETYPTGISVSDEEMDALHIERASFHPEWNYTIAPK